MLEALSVSVSNRLPTILDALRRHRFALALAAILHFGDAVSTHVALGAGLNELNHLPARVLAASGEGGMFGLKFAGIAVVILMICLLEARYPRLWRTVHVTNALMVFVVLSNSTQILLL